MQPVATTGIWLVWKFTPNVGGTTQVAGLLVQSVELGEPEEVVVARFSTEGVALRDEPLLLKLGVSNKLPVVGVAPLPAPEEEPAVLEATDVVRPVGDDWMYRSCRLPGLR